MRAPRSEGSPQGAVLLLSQDARLLGRVQPKPPLKELLRKHLTGLEWSGKQALCPPLTIVSVPR